MVTTRAEMRPESFADAAGGAAVLSLPAAAPVLVAALDAPVPPVGADAGGVVEAAAGAVGALFGAAPAGVVGALVAVAAVVASGLFAVFAAGSGKRATSRS